MSITVPDLIRRFPPDFPQDVLHAVMQEYMEMKREYLLSHWRPNELNGGRFAEGMVRLLQHVAGKPVTPLGVPLASVDSILNSIEQEPTLTPAIRLFVPRVCKVLLNVRNRRDVAHIGGDVSPNHSDAKFVVALADWVMTELVRHHSNCTVDEAAAIVRDLNELRLPVVAEVDGFPRVQNTNLSTKDKILVLLLHRRPDKVRDIDLARWLEYGNISRFRATVLGDLHREAKVHLQGGHVSLLPKGIRHVEDHVPLHI